MQNNNLNDRFSIVISAPSGAGKTTIIKKLITLDESYVLSISTTTRNIRAEEEAGKSYYFVDDNEFNKKIANNEFIEWAVVHDRYYGTTKKEVDRITNIGKTPIFDVDVQGAKQLKNRTNSAVFIFIIPPSISTLKERLRKRASDSEEQISVRLNNAIEELKEYNNYEYVIVNDDIDKALTDIVSIIRAEKCRKNRNINKVKNILEK